MRCKPVVIISLPRRVERENKLENVNSRAGKVYSVLCGGGLLPSGCFRNQVKLLR